MNVVANKKVSIVEHTQRETICVACRFTVTAALYVQHAPEER